MKVDQLDAFDEHIATLEASDDPAARAIGEAFRATADDDLDFEERSWVWLIEDLRAEIERSTTEISIALLSRSGDKRAPLGEIAVLRSKKHPWTTFLMLLVRRLWPERVLELGTGVGTSASYLGAGLRMNGRGRLLTIDGAPGLSEVSRRHLAELGLDGVEVATGLFQDVLESSVERFAPLDLVFVDGHHDEHATLAYFERLLAGIAPGAVVVFDDITWSDGMRRAWAALQVHPAVRLAVDLDQIGVCVVDPAHGGGTTAVVRLPRITQVQPRPAPAPTTAGGERRLRWSAEGRSETGWIVVDRDARRGVHAVAAPQHGLPFADATLDYATSVHVLQELSLDEVLPALAELHRVLVPGGVLRVSVPGLEEMLEHWQRGDVHRFLVPDHQAASPSGKLIVDLLWYGRNRSIFTGEFLEELLRAAGFGDVRRCAPGETTSRHNEIVGADGRPGISLVVEAVR